MSSNITLELSNNVFLCISWHDILNSCIKWPCISDMTNLNLSFLHSNTTSITMAKSRFLHFQEL